MFSEFKALLSRSSDHLAEDAAGAAALVLMLLVGLHVLPVMA